MTRQLFPDLVHIQNNVGAPVITQENTILLQMWQKSEGCRRAKEGSELVLFEITLPDNTTLPYKV